MDTSHTKEQPKVKKMAVLGDRASVLVFKGIGFDVHFVEKEEEIVPLLKKLVESNLYAIFYLTMDVAKTAQNYIDSYREKALPVFIRLPLGRGAEEADDLENLRTSVKQAIGFDVLAHQEEGETYEKH